MIDWTEEKLGSNVTHKKGFAFKSECFRSAGFPIIKVTNFTESSVSTAALEYVDETTYNDNLEYRLSCGDVVVQTVGSWPNNPASVVGKVVKIPRSLEGGLLNQNAVILYPNRKINPPFLYYLLRSNNFKGYIINAAQGAANQASITLDSIFRFSFYLPSPPVQRKIAAILSAYDELIENNKRHIALLEKLAEEIYREWFVRLRFASHGQVKILKRVPTEWSFDKASKFFSLVKGKSYAGDEITDNPEHMPFISLKSFSRGGGYREDGLKFYSGRYKDEQVVHQNDVVVALTDMTQDRAVIGRPARIPNLGQRGAVISLDAVKLVPQSINRTFLYSYMRHSGFSDFIKEFANGANVLHLKPDLIVEQKIIVPQRELQETFALKVGPLYEQVDILSEANKRLITLRDSLLPRLISGKLSVENLDIQFPPGMAEELKVESATHA